MNDTITTSGAGEEPIARTASTVASEAGRAAEHQASRTMDRAADTLEALGDAVRQASEGLREQQPQLASVADMAVEQVERSTRYLRDHQPREVVSGLEAWVRRQPALALGGALMVGIVAGRFLRAASPPADGSTLGGHGRSGRGRDDTGEARYRSAASLGTDRSSVAASSGPTAIGGSTFSETGSDATLDDGARIEDLEQVDPTATGSTAEGVLDDGIDPLAAGTSRVTADTGAR